VNSVFVQSAPTHLIWFALGLPVVVSAIFVVLAGYRHVRLRHLLATGMVPALAERAATRATKVAGILLVVVLALLAASFLARQTP